MWGIVKLYGFLSSQYDFYFGAKGDFRDSTYSCRQKRIFVDMSYFLKIAVLSPILSTKCLSTTALNSSIIIPLQNIIHGSQNNDRSWWHTTRLLNSYTQAWDREKSKKEENCYMWGSAATEPPGGGFGRGVPPPAENFAILGTENHVLMQRKIKKEENCYMWGSAATEPPGGGFGRGVSLPQKILQF